MRSKLECKENSATNRINAARLGGDNVQFGQSDGKLDCFNTSTWDIGGIVARGDYSGTLTSSGGTLTGTQTWRVSEDDGHSRTCQLAVVPAPNAQKLTGKQ
jgi:hypothetical protein